MTKKKFFYDPLYDFISFEDPTGDLLDFFNVKGGFASKHTSTISSQFKKKYILPFIDTYEFKRLNFLRQSGLAFLAFPSATHTRFAHSIGCCNLGYIACQQITIEELSVNNTTSIGGEKTLIDWLDNDDRNWREEFLIALLLHDVGHFPFSHTLESNSMLWECLQNKITHEELACALILGEKNHIKTNQDIYSYFRKFYESKYGVCDIEELDCRFIADLVNENIAIDTNVLCYLISGDDEFCNLVPENKRLELKVLHALVSGLLDLDRIDHYRRDGYFTGLKLGSDLNFTGLFCGMKLVYWKDGTNHSFHLCLSRNAIGHALTLLHSKERLVHDCFEDTRNIAYGAMLHRAINLYLGITLQKQVLNKEQLGKCFEIFLSTDDELLLLLLNSDNQEIREIVLRIKNQKPYTFIARKEIEMSKYGESLKKFKLNLIEFLNMDSEKFVESDILFIHSKIPKQGRAPSAEWMNLEYLYDDSENGGINLLNINDYQAQISYFQQKQRKLTTTFWFFTPHIRKKEILLQKLNNYFQHEPN